jgi:Spy/CpxP family protein refolding chaperone
VTAKLSHSYSIVMNKVKIKVIAGILVVFLLGVIIGALGAGIFIEHKIRQFGTSEHALSKFFMRRLTRELKLTDAQKPEVAKILDQTDQEIRELLQKSFAEFAAIMQHRNTQLKAILTPEQQKKLDELTEQMQQRWHVRPFHGEGQ